MTGARAIPVLVVFAALACPPRHVRATDSPPAPPPGARQEPPEARAWRVQNKCPVNSLYIALHVWGRQVSYRELEDRLPVGRAGSSLKELRDCARLFGADTKVLRLTPEALRACPLPVIAHCEEEKGVTGHYVVVVGISGDNQVEYIDGTTAVTDVLPMSEFRKKWTGHVLCCASDAWWNRLLPAAAFLAAVGLSLITLVCCLGRCRPVDAAPSPVAATPGR
jgi:Peptidase C39 family